MHGFAELIRKRTRPVAGPVRQMHALDAALDKSEHHRARRPAGAQHQRVLDSVPPLRAGVEIMDEAFDVRVGRAQLAALVPQGIGRADRTRPRVGHRQRQRALLVRNGDVGADKAMRRQMQHEFGKAFGRHRLDIVAALDTERPQPIMMDQRRARMRRRPSDQACCARFAHSRDRQSCRGARSMDAVTIQIRQAGFQVNAAASINHRSRHHRRDRATLFAQRKNAPGRQIKSSALISVKTRAPRMVHEGDGFIDAPTPQIRYLKYHLLTF